MYTLPISNQQAWIAAGAVALTLLTAGGAAFAGYAIDGEPSATGASAASLQINLVQLTPPAPVR